MQVNLKKRNFEITGSNGDCEGVCVYMLGRCTLEGTYSRYSRRKRVIYLKV